MAVQATSFSALPDEIRGYRIGPLLGAGAMGAVYRALAEGGRRGLQKGDEVALKILDPRFAPDASIVRRFKREAGVGLGASHPGIALVHEIGSLRVPGGRRLHYIVQELLKGGSVQSRLELEGAQPEPVVREVGRQVAEALAFVHGRNIVHRDLKPANLFLDERGQVKVVDFGLARLVTEVEVVAAERDASSAPPPSTGATSSGKFLGTVAYAAPEQLDGTPATVQSDLFSLGLVLHEMTTGSHPFARERDEGFDAYVLALQARDAPPLTDLRPDVSCFLERMVERLLARDPAKRFASAAAVAESFAQGERSQFWAAATAPLSPYVSRARRSLAVRRVTRLLGRSHEIATLTDDVQAAAAGRGRCVVLEGESGIGKTRLVDALIERLERRGPKHFVVVAHSDDVSSSSSSAPPPPLQELKQLASERPVLYVLDAIERADAALLRDALAVAGELATQPILMLVLRASDLPLPRAIAPLLTELTRGASRHLLGPLEAGVYATMARDLAFDPRVLDPAAARLHELSAGIPGVAIELATWLREHGRDAALVGKRTWMPALPPALVERFARKAKKLAADERALLEAAAVLGSGLRVQTLRDILGQEGAAFDALVRRLELERGLVHRQGGTLRFHEPLLRRHLVAVTPKERRRAIHLLAARHYERELALPNPSPRTSLKAAIHADLAHERTILAATLRPAVRILEVEGALERAWKLVTSAEKSARAEPEDERLLAHALVLRGQLAHRLGRREDEREIWGEAARLSTKLDDPVIRAHAFHGLGRLASRTGRFLAAETLLLDADQAAQKAPRGSGVDRSLILLDRAEALLWSGDEEGCGKALEQAEQVIDAGAAISSIGRYFKERGNMLLELERFDEAGDSYSQGRAIVRGPALRPLHRAMVLGTARLLREIADFDKARRAVEVARESAASDLDLRHLAQAWYVLGDLESRAGRPDAALQPYVQALRLARRVEDDYLEASTLGSLSFLYRWKRFSGHSLVKAVRLARRAISKAHSMAVGRLEVRGLAALALCYRDMRKMPWALAIARKAVREGSAAGVHRRRAAEIYWVHGLILGEMGQTAEANASLDEARRRIERRLLGVASPAVRARMMERDPLLREIEATRFGS